MKNTNDPLDYTEASWKSWIVNTKLDNFFVVPLLELSRTQVIQRTVNPQYG